MLPANISLCCPECSSQEDRFDTEGGTLIGTQAHLTSPNTTSSSASELSYIFHLLLSLNVFQVCAYQSIDSIGPL